MEKTQQYSRRKFRAFFGVFIVTSILVLAAAVMWLWNAILPTVTGVRPITYWQALGLLVLCRILFGGFHFGRRSSGPPAFVRHRFGEKFMNMTDEEKAAFREEWKARCKKD